MFPVLFRIGPLTFHTYGLMAAAAVLLGARMAIHIAGRAGCKGPEVEESFYTLLLHLVLGGIIGARILYAATHWHEFSGDLFGVFRIWEGGLVSFGGLAGALAGFAIWQKSQKWIGWKESLDILAAPMALGQAVGRLGCLAAGCCYGRPADFPWTVTFSRPDSLAPLGIRLHPTQVYEFLILSAIGGFTFFRMEKGGRQRPKGRLFADYVILYGIGRFLVDFFRGDEPLAWGLTPGQHGSLVLLAAALIFRRVNART
ncbi:MAG: hypothetical protein A2636_04670 [Elusimicrobia bacterium RIFCSPHIGHO2_01_FULL_64_10]|nr:MAG: hypothetical protein A2636_04670 [Elusimicrobia bacterium RIFCSPHIGHO2_01_FULL_64_10]